MLPGPNPPILSTWKGKSCWCCGRPFFSQEGLPISIVNEHHVVPRACGGTNGPTVSLNSEHHDLLHRVADARLANKPWQHLCAALPAHQQARILYLADVVYRSTLSTQGEPNRRFLLNVELPPDVGNKLRQLARYYNTSHAKTVAVLIDTEHRRLALHLKGETGNGR